VSPLCGGLEPGFSDNPDPRLLFLDKSSGGEPGADHDLVNGDKSGPADALMRRIAARGLKCRSQTAP
jgi:hypothetical protein